MSQSVRTLVSAKTTVRSANGLTHTTLSGLLWTFIGTGAQAALQLLVLIVLARLLTPADFGVVTAALVVVGFTTIFSQLGVGPALVQYPALALEERHVRTGFTLTLALGAAMTALVAALAPVIAAFFRMPTLTPVVQVLSTMFVLQALGVVPESLMQRELRFRILTIVEVGALALGFGIVGIGLAWAGFGVWALVGANLAQAAVKTIALIALEPHPKRPLLDRKALSDLLYFGGGFTAARIGNYFGVQGDNLVVGRWLGAVPLGAYGRAYQLMAAPATLFGQVLDRVLFPAMVKVQGEQERLMLAYRRGVALIALVILPASAVLFVVAPEIVRLFLGPGWSAVVLPLQIFAVGMLFRTSYKMSDSLARAKGAVYRRAWRQSVYAGLVVLGALCGTIWDLPGVAVGVVAALGVNFLFMAHLSLSLSGLSWRAFWSAHRPAVALATLVGIEAAGLAALLRAVGLGPFLVLGVVGLAAAATAFALPRFAPGVFLGLDGHWMLRTLGEYLPRSLRELTHVDDAAFGEPRHAHLPTSERPTGEPAKTQALGVVRGLAAELEREGVAYCHFKSNEHVLAGARGETDLDILVDRGAVPGLMRALSRAGFKRFAAAPGRGYPAVEDYLGFDPETGCLVHLHLHYRLVVGRPHLKELHLPWEAHLLSTRQWEGIAGLWIADPHAELVLLLARAVLKRRWRDRVRSALSWGAVPAETLRELRWLRDRIVEDRLRAVASDLLGAAAADEVVAMVEEGPRDARMSALARLLRARLPLASAYGRLGLPARAALAEMRALHAGLARRWLQPLRPCRRVLPQGGVLVALLGPDGSGKSTLARDIVRWLSWKVDARLVYFGSGDGPSSLLRLPLKILLPLGRLVLKRHGTAAREGGMAEASTGHRRRSRIAGALQAVWALALAREKQIRLRRAWRARHRGLIVICDRYPQAQIEGFNDGPLLARWLRDGVPARGWLARRESGPYLEAAARPPDLVVKLSVSPRVARKRKPEMREDELARRSAAIDALSFPPETRVEIIDADEPLETVRRRVREVVWQAL